jgi:octaprenyl-diphosphate synthase
MFSKIRQSVLGHEISELVQADLALVEREIGVESVASVEAITTINQYLQAGGGKRLRPVLLLLTTRLFGPATDTARRLAAVVEMIHTATLVHDDVIDVARTRRGRPSINVVWGNHTSVLAGDWLYMQAFQLALRERNFHILDALISLTQMMVEGELLQLERLRQLDISEADYMELVDRKTACLFSACARLGAAAAGADEPGATSADSVAANCRAAARSAAASSARAAADSRSCWARSSFCCAAALRADVSARTCSGSSAVSAMILRVCCSRTALRSVARYSRRRNQVGTR